MSVFRGLKVVKTTCKAVKRLGIMIPLVTFFSNVPAGIASSILGSAQNFAVLGGSTVTNTGLTTIGGSLGVSPGTAITGSPSVVGGTTDGGDAVAFAAQFDATTAYNALSSLAPSASTPLNTNDLTGLTLLPGVYNFSGSIALNGPLILDAENNPNALFIFQIGSTLITEAGTAGNHFGGSDQWWLK
jgi:hypothetical protein